MITAPSSFLGHHRELCAYTGAGWVCAVIVQRCRNEDENVKKENTGLHIESSFRLEKTHKIVKSSHHVPNPPWPKYISSTSTCLLNVSRDYDYTLPWAVCLDMESYKVPVFNSLSFAFFFFFLTNKQTLSPLQFFGLYRHVFSLFSFDLLPPFAV